ncbi:MAG TPA: restriction endonuclease, partial [Anaerolineae bacterium]|nr:restriction endonuclease [Anaerolineae bacterium]
GTMNTADRSLALVDHALRRRFTFIPLTPDYDQLATFHQPQPPFIPHLINLLQEINQTINDPHFHLGTSYFLHPRLPENLPAIWQWEIEPYLEEYFFDRPQLVDQYRWTAIKPRLKL